MEVFTAGNVRVGTPSDETCDATDANLGVWAGRGGVRLDGSLTSSRVL